MIFRFHISTTRPSQSLERLERSVRRTSSVTMPTASSYIVAGSTKAAQLGLARGRPESLARPCVRLRPPVWRRLTKRRLLAARSNGRTNKAESCPKRPTGYRKRVGWLSLVILAGPGGSQSLGCKLDECLDQRRNVSAARIHGIKPANWRRVVVENAAQPPVPDKCLGDLVGQLSDAITCNRCGNHRLHFIGGEASRRRDRFLPTRSVQHPVSAAGRGTRNDAVMASEVRRRYRDAAASLRAISVESGRSPVRKARSIRFPTKLSVSSVRCNSTLVFG